MEKVENEKLISNAIVFSKHLTERPANKLHLNINFSFAAVNRGYTVLVSNLNFCRIPN